MIPIFNKLRRVDVDYKYGFRWIVKCNGYSVKVRSYKAAFKIWKKEIKSLIPSFFFIKHDFYKDEE